ncbi:hypothetical protein VKT23_017613 [Stygiomarasmius scandens]|uniref:SWR1-complex protein 5 n=1 Tax=Marasmiellus scandens TaxID=2682957 RepID=A0ABR1IU51_9AGAR
MPPSDSEDDGDYVPPAGDAASSSSDSDNEEPMNKKARTSSPKLSEEHAEAKKKAREELWKNFKESIASEASSPKPETSKLVKIEKRYRFAGEEVVEVVEVPEDSADAKKWPLWAPAPSSNSEAPGASSPKPENIPLPTPDTSKASTSATRASTASAKPGPKRPGPRKSKITLASLPSSSKPKKITTLEKSAMDWRTHVNSVDEGTKDELEANRKEGGGGYLEKVEFLDRVSERREGVLEAGKSGKRRR